MGIYSNTIFNNGEIMKQELITKFTDKLLQYAESAEMFASKNVPLYVEELLRYKFMEHVFTFMLPVILLVVLTVVALGIIRLTKTYPLRNEYKNVNDAYIFPIIVIPIMYFVLLGTTVGDTRHLMQAYKIKAAPRVYIIDYLRNK